MNYTQQQIAQLYKKLFPQITEDANNVQITLKGQTFSFVKPKAIASVKSRNLKEFR